MAAKRSRARNWCQVAKAPGPPLRTWKQSPGREQRNAEANGERARQHWLAQKLDQVLGRATYVDDLLEECGFGKTKP